MNRLTILATVLFFWINSFGQEKLWTGKIIDCNTRQPVEGVQFRISAYALTSTLSNSMGEFYFKIPASITPGTDLNLEIVAKDWKYCNQEDRENGKVLILPKDFQNKAIPTISILKLANDCDISITSPSFGGKNTLTWCDPTIKNWRPTGGSYPDQEFTISGTCNKPPAGGYITLSVMIDREYYQNGQWNINSNGNWTGKIYFRTSDGTRVSKSIIVYVKSSTGETINTCQFFIQSCN